MTKTRDNHYVPQWHQKGFFDEKQSQLRHLKRRDIDISNDKTKSVYSKKWYTPAQIFYERDLYSTFFGTELNDEIEQKLFGPIDNNGSKAVRAFLTDDQSQWHHNFQDFFAYLDAQKLRTPKGLDWIKSKYPELSQSQLMLEMQSLRSMHCTLWTEGVRELVSAETSEVKFILSDHPVTVYNYSCPPESELCGYPNDPDISLKGSQTIFPLDKNRCLILTNLEYAQDPDNVNPLAQRTNATRIRRSMVNTIEFINTRKLSSDEVAKINFVIKSRAKSSVAAGRDEWLHPVEDGVNFDWAEIRQVLLPLSGELHRFGGEMYAKFEDGSTHYQDAFGRTTPNNDYLNKNNDENNLGRNDPCGCGSGRKYKQCCVNVSENLRTTWDVLSIRERNLAFCNCIRDTLGLDDGKTWQDVRRELSDDQISKIYHFYSVLWPSETDVYSLLPKSDGKFRGLYTGPLDVRVISVYALPMASLFDEFLMETPITNPNNISPEFCPIKCPGKYKYQALKEFLFMLEMEPYIELGLINLIPDPSDFDHHLMKAMMEMAKGRGRTDKITSEKDRQLFFRLATEDVLNTIAMMPRDVRIKTLIQQFGVTEEIANETISELDENADLSPLMPLQAMSFNEGGQFTQSRMGPNYEMALFIAQVTGSRLVTDSGSRFQELMSAQHRDMGMVNYPWGTALGKLDLVPIDSEFLDKFRKTQHHFSVFRNIIKSIDRLVFRDDKGGEDLCSLVVKATKFSEQAVLIDDDKLLFSELKIICPQGGFYDSNVQRLLVCSSCTNYDHKVISVYGVGCF